MKEIANKNLHDSHLWENLQMNNCDALTEIIRTRYAGLLRFGMALGFEKETVKDAIQNTFLSLWEHRDRMDTIKNPKAYIFYVLRNTLLQEQKKGKQKKTFWQWLSFSNTTETSIEDHWIETEITSENYKYLERILSEMHPREREVIQLRFYEGLDNEAIADIMGINKQSVANLLVRTLSNFRHKWQGIVVSFFLIFM